MKRIIAMSDAAHWSKKKEQVSSYRYLRLMLLFFRVVPVIFVKLFMLPLSFVYFCIASEPRRHSRKFLKTIEKQTPHKKLYSSLHFLSFALNLIEKMESWSGKIPFNKIKFQHDDIQKLIPQLEQGKGAVLLCSHLGNAELLRALAEFNRTGVSRQIKTISIVDFSGSAFFNKMIEEINPESMLHIISANSIGPDTVIMLQEHLDAGGLVVIAGDRTSANTQNRYFEIPFLEKPAPFASGVFILASLLKVPCYAVFGLRHKDISLCPSYDMFIQALDIPEQVTRKERETAAKKIAAEFSIQLARLCVEHPYQWYNFYDFWAKPES